MRTWPSWTTWVEQAKKLARLITGGVEQCDLFEVPSTVESVEARLDRVRVERGRRFGDVERGVMSAANIAWLQQT